MFYSNEEFEAQVQWLIDQGWDEAEAIASVRQQEIADEFEYNTLRDTEASEPRADDFINDSWYENQYELDTEYI
jgi:hypothetical protein